MEKREDYWWRESTLGEDVDGKVGTYLRANLLLCMEGTKIMRN